MSDFLMEGEHKTAKELLNTLKRNAIHCARYVDESDKDRIYFRFIFD